MKQILTKEQALSLIEADVSLENDEREVIRAKEAAKEKLAEVLAWQIEAEQQRESQNKAEHKE